MTIAPKNINARERTRILALLTAIPLPEVRRRTGRSFITLARIAETGVGR